MAVVEERLWDEIRQHAARDYPRESCGFVIVLKGRQRYIPIRNVAERNEHFVMDHDEQTAAEDTGEVVAVVHSHPNLPPIPSQADLIGCERSKVPWLIVNWPTGAIYEFAPSGYKAPLYGRQFAHGVLDCYTWIQAYYSEMLGISLPNFVHPDEWWLKGQNLYLEGFGQAGFAVVDKPHQHDVLLMKMASPVPNHGAVFLGDGCIGHHHMGRLSSRDVYGGWYEKVTTHILRHESFKP
jgi:proteasome lid subunit RPN8/RPN11